MASVEFSDSYRIASFGYPTNYVRINYTEVQYDAANNRTQVRLDGVYIKYTGAAANSRCFGTLKFNGTNVLTMSGSPYTLTVDESYTYVSGSGNGSTIWVQHNSPSGTATLSVSLTGGTRNDDNDDVFGALYYYGSGYPVIGVRTTATKNVSLTTRTTTLTVNPNGGTWNGSTASQSFSQAPTSTKTIANPSRTGYTFKGWTLTGGGSFSGATYTYGGSNGTLTAQWQLNSYTISFDANGGEDAPEAVTKTYGVTLTLPTAIPTRTGYGFLGWSTDSAATTATYQAGGSFTANATTQLYAVWRVISYSLAATVSDRGIIANILRTASPIGGAASGLLADGDTVYYNDVIKVSWAISGGYQAETFQINGEDARLLTEKTITVTEQPVIFLVVKLGAMVYIGNDMYQAFINDGTGWSQYQAYIGNGSSWEAY